jgi:hypothetical protein
MYRQRFTNELAPHPSLLGKRTDSLNITALSKVDATQ